MNDIHPTHSCFDDALDFLVDRCRVVAPGRRHRYRLVHGIVLSRPDWTPPDTRYAHGWVEEDTPQGAIVWSSGLLDGQRLHYSVQREEWYRLHRPQEWSVYDLADALAENKRTGHYGPWLRRYRVLCGGGTVFGGLQVSAR